MDRRIGKHGDTSGMIDTPAQGTTGRAKPPLVHRNAISQHTPKTVAARFPAAELRRLSAIQTYLASDPSRGNMQAGCHWLHFCRINWIGLRISSARQNQTGNRHDAAGGIRLAKGMRG